VGKIDIFFNLTELFEDLGALSKFFTRLLSALLDHREHRNHLSSFLLLVFVLRIFLSSAIALPGVVHEPRLFFLFTLPLTTFVAPLLFLPSRPLKTFNSENGNCSRYASEARGARRGYG